MKADLPTDIAVAAQAGFQGLEIWAAKMDAYLLTNSVAALKGLFDLHGVQPVSINSIALAFRDQSAHDVVRARCRQLAEIGAALGCDKVVVVPSPMPDGGASWDEIRSESVQVLHDLADVAQHFGVKLGFEFLGFPWCSVRTLSQAWEIVKDIRRPEVGLVLDTCHFYAGGSDLKSILDVEAHKLLILHLNDVEDRPRETIEDAHRLLPGEGVIPLDDILIRLKHIGFDGAYSVELFRPEYWELDPAELARRAHTAALEVLKPYLYQHPSSQGSAKVKRQRCQAPGQ